MTQIHHKILKQTRRGPDISSRINMQVKSVERNGSVPAQDCDIQEERNKAFGQSWWLLGIKVS